MREHLELRHPTALVRGRIEDVEEHPPDVGSRPGLREAGHRRLVEMVVPADFVDAEDVIGVAVCEDDRIDAAQIVRQGLRP